MPLPLLALTLACAGPAQEPPPGPPPPHPGFQLPTVDGGQGGLADFLGCRTVVVHFASW